MNKKLAKVHGNDDRGQPFSLVFFQESFHIVAALSASLKNSKKSGLWAEFNEHFVFFGHRRGRKTLMLTVLIRFFLKFS